MLISDPILPIQTLIDPRETVRDPAITIPTRTDLTPLIITDPAGPLIQRRQLRHQLAMPLIELVPQVRSVRIRHLVPHLLDGLRLGGRAHDDHATTAPHREGRPQQ